MYNEDSPVKQIKTTVSPLPPDGEEGIYYTEETSQLICISEVSGSLNVKTKFTGFSTKEFFPVRFTYSSTLDETEWQINSKASHKRMVLCGRFYR